MALFRTASQALKSTLIMSNCVRPNIRVLAFTNNSFSTVNSPMPKNQGVSKSVFISQSNDIFSNLALEDWLYKNFDFSNHHVMLLWRNDPCVVIGRHQNPWLEVNVEYLNSRGITLARRNSGGGTVYHDKGNLNITFFTPHERYNRKQNLLLVEKTLRREWGLNIEINKREDLILDSVYKVSGTASKLGRPNAYHHCTLMIDVNKEDLKFALQKEQEEKFSTTALRSTRAKIVNLSDAHSEVQMERLMERLGWEFMRTAENQDDAGWNHVSKQNGFHMINPTDQWFPGLAEVKDEFSSWKWKFGKTPDFVVERWISVGPGKEAGLKISVEAGVVTADVSLILPEGLTWGNLSGVIPLQTTIVGQKYSPNLFQILEKAVLKQGFSFAKAQEKTAVSAS